MILHDTVDITIPDPVYGDSDVYINNVKSHRNRGSDYLAVADGPTAKISTLEFKLSVCNGDYLYLRDWVDSHAGSDCTVTLYGVTYDAYLDTTEYTYQRMGDFVTTTLSIWLWEQES